MTTKTKQKTKKDDDGGGGGAEASRRASCNDIPSRVCTNRHSKTLWKVQGHSLAQPVGTKLEAELDQRAHEAAVRKKGAQDDAAALTSARAAIEETTTKVKVDAAPSSDLTAQISCPKRGSLLPELNMLKQEAATDRALHH